MSTLELGPTDALRYEHNPPANADGMTFVGVNALTGDWTTWENTVGERLRAAGHGTLLWNFRGQTDSPVPVDTPLDADLIVRDTLAVLEHCVPARPVLVGLSIGGLFAARAILAGAPAVGLVLINTLRRPGPRLSWINDAVARCAEVGGLNLLRDLYSPLLFTEEWLGANRESVFGQGGYEPIERTSGPYRLLRDCAGADWDVPYESLSLPVLVVTGLQDRVFRDPADVERLAGRLPDARRQDFEDAGHMVPIEQPGRFAEALIAFAAEL
jgi:pimeloyl-ACP methyl ester carboxylesterase